jgi:hypothetical protein
MGIFLGSPHHLAAKRSDIECVIGMVLILSRERGEKSRFGWSTSLCLARAAPDFLKDFGILGEKQPNFLLACGAP